MAELVALTEASDAAAGRLLARLEERGHTIRRIVRTADAAHAARLGRADAILVDAAVADDEFLVRLRRDHPAQILIAWLARSSSAAVADLLEGGADEVLEGAMGERELLARATAALARERRPVGAAFELGPLVVDAAHGEATWEGRDLMLTRREREVLEVLAASAGRTVRREVVYRRVWGYAMPRGERSVDVNVKRLRRKLAATAGDALEIKTQPGVGYRLELAEEREAAPVTAL